MQEVVPFLMANYPIRPERESHALLGMSGGGYGAMNMAIKYRGFFGVVATMASPVNMRYSDCVGGNLADFNPATYCPSTTYDPDMIIGVFYCGLYKDKARKFISPIFGDGPDVAAKITATNPADLLFTTDLRPGELAIYLHYPGQDNFNFDAHALSFQWLAAQKGVGVDLGCDPEGTHTLHYFRDNLPPVLSWLGQHVFAGPLPVASGALPGVGGQQPVVSGPLPAVSGPLPGVGGP
jgi:hypothetical protein